MCRDREGAVAFARACFCALLAVTVLQVISSYPHRVQAAVDVAGSGGRSRVYQDVELEGCQPEKLTVYKVILHTFWSRDKFPKHYPDWRPSAQWSKVFEGRPKIEEFELVIEKYSDEEFRENFRMFRTTFDYILSLIENKITKSIIEVGRQTIPGKTQLLLTIWYFSTPDSFRSICGRFNVGRATAQRCIRRVTNSLLELSPIIIKWPTDEYIVEVKEGFQRMGFPNTVGAIDGTYIPISLPKEYGLSYICRKNFPAIILQGICDHKLLFTHCYAGEVGSVHDARVLRKSVWNYLMDVAEEKFPQNSHLVGDKAYPCMQNLMTPYKDNGRLTQIQRNYNHKLSAARNTIERAFALLKNRMRRLKYLDVRLMDWIPKYIIACCVLYNICILKDDIFDIEEEIEENQMNQNDNEQFDENQVRQQGFLKRDQICAVLARQ